jgi:hypothetical protein
LKIRVSLVRFPSRPPFRTVVLLCRTAVFLILGRPFNRRSRTAFLPHAAGLAK